MTSLRVCSCRPLCKISLPLRPNTPAPPQQQTAISRPAAHKPSVKRVSESSVKSAICGLHTTWRCARGGLTTCRTRCWSQFANNLTAPRPSARWAPPAVPHVRYWTPASLRPGTPLQFTAVRCFPDPHASVASTHRPVPPAYQPVMSPGRWDWDITLVDGTGI